MNMKIVLFLAITLLSACATTYQPYSYVGGGGYKDVQLSENGFKVTFEANGYTSKNQATDMALLRSADLAIQKGFKYFVVVSATDDSGGMIYRTPTTTTATVSGVGNTAYGTAQTYGGQSFLITFPTPSLTILCFKEQPTVSGMVYEATLVSRSMKSQYGIQ